MSWGVAWLCMWRMWLALRVLHALQPGHPTKAVFLQDSSATTNLIAKSAVYQFHFLSARNLYPVPSRSHYLNIKIQVCATRKTWLSESWLQRTSSETNLYFLPVSLSVPLVWMIRELSNAFKFGKQSARYPKQEARKINVKEKRAVWVVLRNQLRKFTSPFARAYFLLVPSAALN